MFRVFLGAPSANNIDNPPTSYQWQTVSRTSMTQPVVLSPAFIDAASRRISLIYENAIFDKSYEEGTRAFEDESSKVELANAGKSAVVRYQTDQTTMVSWPPTADGYTGSRIPLSFFQGSYSTGGSYLETQESQSQSFNYSDASSIARLPTFHFRLDDLISLGDIKQQSRKVKVLVVVLEVDGPDMIRIKKGPDAGQEIAILKLILSDEEGSVGKLTAWREVAETWGGVKEAVGVNRGDIVLLENVLAISELKMSPTLSASPNMNSTMTICYRTLPRLPEDSRLRPEIRLNDPCVRKVAAVVRWFEGVVGL